MNDRPIKPRAGARRRLFHLAALLSAVVCLAAAGVWTLSYWRLIGIERVANDYSIIGLAALRGSVVFTSFRPDPSAPAAHLNAERIYQLRYEPARLWGLPGHGAEPAILRRVGIRYGASPFAAGGGSTFAVFPCWPVVAISLPLPLLWLVLWLRVWLPAARRRRRQALGLCPACAYDLRGTVPTGGTECPECGAAIPAQPRPATK
jgi:hypothetical protein